MSQRRYHLHLGDCREVLRYLPDASVDSIVTDPPYELGFMGKGWDSSGVANDVTVWREALRVLKPGGHLLAFSGSRTYHRMACAIEDAGFELRDQIMWLYGSGFPKSLDVSKAIDKAAGAEREVVGRDQRKAQQQTAKHDTSAYGEFGGNVGDITAPATDAARQWQGWGTALKPAHEPICVARKPLVGTVAANVLEHGTGALNIDASRVHPTGERLGGGDELGKAAKPEGWARPWMDDPDQVAAHSVKVRQNVEKATLLGRWPANVIHDGSEEVIAAFPDAPGQLARARTDGMQQRNAVFGVLKHVTQRPDPRMDLDQSAARFFYCAKASRADRNEGLDSSNTPAVATDATMRQCETADWRARNGNHHPTVKPTELMAYLCRLITPPGGIVLDPFMGSGSTGKAAMREGFRFIGIDMTPEYVEIARARIAHALNESERAATPDIDPRQQSLFDQDMEHAA